MSNLSNLFKKNNIIRNIYIDTLELRSIILSFFANNVDIYDEQILHNLNVKGYVVIKNFFADDKCEALLHATNQVLANCETEYTNGDLRSFGAENNTTIKGLYSENNKIKNIMHNYLGSNPDFDSTLAAKLSYVKGNLGSGQGWHRDSYSKQIKSILYLTDANEENGAFEYIIGSNNKERIKNDSKFLCKISDGGYNGLRLTHENVMELCRNFDYKAELVTGNAGDLIIADTRGLHRGSPIKTGERIALTNYYAD
mgnify:CR=1 FL=1|tara:strand:- start:1069 stop:1833 length:765 start_codon:yes stop_codon:yes gene_type:complete